MSTAAGGRDRRCATDRRGAAAQPVSSAIRHDAPLRSPARPRPSALAFRPYAPSGHGRMRWVAPRDVAGQHEVDLANAGTETVAAQRLCISRWNGVTVDVQQRRWCGVIDHHPGRRRGNRFAEHHLATVGPQIGDQRVGDHLRPTDRHRPACPCASTVLQHHARAPLLTGDGIRRNRMHTNAGEQRASVLAAEQSPRRAALGPTPAAPVAHRGQAGPVAEGPLSPRKKPEYTVDVFGQRAEPAVATMSRRRALRTCAPVRGVRLPRRAGPAVGWRRTPPEPPGSTPRAARSNSAKNGGCRPPTDGTAEQMSWEHAGEISGPGLLRAPPPGGRLGLDDTHRQACSCADDGRGQAVGSAAYDGHVHPRNSKPITLGRRESSCSSDRRQARAVHRRGIGRRCGGAMGRRPDRGLLAAVPEAERSSSVPPPPWTPRSWRPVPNSRSSPAPASASTTSTCPPPPSAVSWSSTPRRPTSTRPRSTPSR